MHDVGTVDESHCLGHSAREHEYHAANHIAAAWKHGHKVLHNKKLKRQQQKRFKPNSEDIVYVRSMLYSNATKLAKKVNPLANI